MTWPSWKWTEADLSQSRWSCGHDFIASGVLNLYSILSHNNSLVKILNPGNNRYTNYFSVYQLKWQPWHHVCVTSPAEESHCLNMQQYLWPSRAMWSFFFNAGLMRTFWQETSACGIISQCGCLRQQCWVTAMAVQGLGRTILKGHIGWFWTKSSIIRIRKILFLIYCPIFRHRVGGVSNILNSNRPRLHKEQKTLWCR